MEKVEQKVMLGCWNIGGSLGDLKDTKSKHLVVERGPFSGKTFPSSSNQQSAWRLPPLARYTHDGVDFMPFILYDQVTIDKLSFDCLIGARESLEMWKPGKESVAILESLAADDYIVLEDYGSKLNDPELIDLIDKMVMLDVSDSNIVMPCKESLRLWIQFYKDLFKVNDYLVYNFYDMLSNLDGNSEANDAFGYLYECVADINRALVLSQTLGQPIYEWEDYNQFYKYKFLRTGQAKVARSTGHTLHELFDAFIPNFHVTSYSQLLDLRGDRRIASVRRLANKIGDENVSQDLVVQAYEDVVLAKKSIETFSRYVGIFGFLLDLLPVPIGNVFELTANSIYKKWKERDIKWQTFFVEKAIQYSKRDIEDRLRQQS